MANGNRGSLKVSDREINIINGIKLNESLARKQKK